MDNSIITSIIQYGFIQRAFVSGIFIAILCSILGLFLVLRRFSLIGDGLSHVSFGAVALGLFLGIFPFYLAIPIVILSALGILAIIKKTKIYADAVIGIISSLGLSIGIVLASKSNGFSIDLMSYLFGNILAISREEMIVSIVLAVVVSVFIYFFYYDLFSSTFNEEQARVSGINVTRINMLLVTLTSITIVLSIRIVGTLLISAFLILPSVTALQFAQSFKQTILLSMSIAIFSVITGIVCSFIFNTPTGATIVLTNFLLFILVVGIKAASRT